MKPVTPKYVHTYKDRHEKWRHQFRHSSLPHKIPLPQDHLSAEFAAAYADCLKRLEDDATATSHPAGSLSALITAYKASPEYGDKGDNTKRSYDRYMDYLGKHFGDLPVATIPREFVIKIRNKNKDRPRTANYIVQVLSLLITYSQDLGWRTDNPAIGVSKLKTGMGSRPWDLLDIAKVKRVADKELLWLIAGALFTGQRQGDLMKMLWSDVKGGIIKVTQEKTGKDLWIPIHPLFAKVLDKIPKTQMVIFTTQTGRPWKQRYLIRRVKEATEGAKLEGVITFHGLRKTACAALADAGCTRDEIRAITGQSNQMVDYYIQRSQTKRRARAGISKLKRGK